MTQTTFYLAVSILVLDLTTNIQCFSYNFRLHNVKRITTTQDVDTAKVWISQPVDHFNDTELRNFRQKYLENPEFYKANGPAYIFIGDEQEVYANYLLEGYIYDLARETNGILYNIEHRYYGESNPLDLYGPDYVANLKYLSSKQALADIANFIKAVVKKNHPTSKIVVIGDSYAGSLATWLTAKYPDLVNATLASSAPILAKFDFYEYLETTTHNFIKYGGSTCYDYVKKMFGRYSELLKTDEGIAIIQKEDGICSETDLKKTENQQYFMVNARYRFTDLVQYAYNEKEIIQFCNKITSNNTQLADIDNGLRQPLQCDLESDVKILLAHRESSQLRWFYQTCTEFSYSMTTNSSEQIFSSLVPETFISTLCKHIFGDEFTEEFIKEKVKQTNHFYNGLHPHVKNVVFYNGELDPWHRLSVVKAFSHDVSAFFVPKSSHTQDLNPARESDPEELIMVRKVIKNIIKAWIGFNSTSS